MRFEPRRIGATLLLAAGLAAVAPTPAPAGAASAAATRPCDIYGNAGTPCVAAHSTTRALFGAYAGPLYRVQRATDGAARDIGVQAPGAFADAAAQDAFCRGTTCVITVIYDQSSKHNDLTVAPAGTNGAADRPAPADALPITAGGRTVYGVSINGVMGYRNNRTTGVPTGSEPEGMYMVTSGTHVNDRCCFDYGNAETNNAANRNGAMDAIYFGTLCWFGPCNGTGPWVMADLEHGLFRSDAGASRNPADTGNRAPYVTAMLKNNGTDFFALKNADATTGGLTTSFAGPLPTSPPGYSPMAKEGAIILGIGGDNSNGSIGSFFEGVMTAGLPSDAADAAVQADIVAVGYGGPSPAAPGTLTPGSTLSLRATTPGYTDRYVRHQRDAGVTSVITAAGSAVDKGDGSWIARPGLADPSCVSFASRNFPGDFLRHRNFALVRQSMDGSALFRADATFCPTAGRSGSGTSFASLNYPDRYLRHYANTLYIASNGGPNVFDAPASWAADVTWQVTSPWTP